MADWEDRIKQANETFSRFVPEAEPERVFASMERKLGALGTLAFSAVGEMWNRPQLSRRDRSLMIISVLAAQSRDEELVGHTKIGLKHGLTQEEIEEINLHIAAYAGFPAAMAASRYIDEAFCEAFNVDKITDRKPAEHLDDDERLKRAADVRRTLTGGRASDNPEQDLANLQSHLGDLGEWAMKWAFGEIWSRPQLSRRDRSLVVIAILTALGQEAELAFHVPGGLNHGLTVEEIEEMMTHMCLYV
ncbi:MAG: carboxymuconolactone decarboxylase family protein, partial [Pseudomonadales bacterium]|nr:carboxymuconolactone decarboxylase family protein [Pseudomonadales bacterium]